MHPRERLAFSPIEKRPPLKFPKGVRLMVWPVLALEEWDMGRPMARMVISPPQGQPMLPDHPNWSWHEYGMRVGFWRLRKVLQELGVSPTVTLNARVCETYPQVVQACLESGWELNAHGYDQVPMHKAEDQRGVIVKSMDMIEKFSGKRPRGWFGPGLTQTFDTLDYLSEAGVEYIGDWVLDDEPVTLKTTHKPVVALPYNFEIHDIVMMALQHHPSEVMYTRAHGPFQLALCRSQPSGRKSWPLPAILISPARRTASAMCSGPTTTSSPMTASSPGMAKKFSTGISRSSTDWKAPR